MTFRNGRWHLQILANRYLDGFMHGFTADECEWVKRNSREDSDSGSSEAASLRRLNHRDERWSTFGSGSGFD